MPRIPRLLLLILLLPVPLWPAEAPATPAEQPAPLFSDAEWQRGQPAGTQPAAAGGEVVGKAAVGLLLSLLAIGVVAAVLAVAVKKFGMRRVLPGRGRHLTVVETVPLGFKRSLSLVRIGDQVLVVGQGEHELSHLATLPASILDARPAPAEGTADAPPAPEVPPVPAAPSSFRTLLEAVGGRRP